MSCNRCNIATEILDDLSNAFQRLIGCGDFKHAKQIVDIQQIVVKIFAYKEKKE